MNADILAYIGPETAMPLLSAIAAIFGVFLMVGKTTVLYLGRMLCKPFVKRPVEQPVEPNESSS